MLINDDKIDYRLLPIERLSQLEIDLKTSLPTGHAGDFIQKNYMAYDFTQPKEYRSILIVSFPQAHGRMEIETEHGIYEATIPSGYYKSPMAEETPKAILQALEQQGIQAKKVHLPLKLIGARSGLTQYGKNNISYVKDFGSQHRLMAFYTDLAGDPTLWVEGSDMDLATCDSCGLCEDACPYNAIPSDKFILDPNRCLSFYMDLADPLPEWTRQAPLKSLVGCNHCQDICPLNSKFVIPPETQLGRITLQSTQDILSCQSYLELQPDTQAQFQTLDIEAWYDVFRRNFSRFLEDAYIRTKL